MNHFIIIIKQVLTGNSWLSTPTLFVRIPVTVLGAHEHSIILNQNTKLSRNSVTQSIRLTLLFFAGHRFSINQDTTHSLPPCLLSVMCTTKVGRKCAIFYKCTSALHVSLQYSDTETNGTQYNATLPHGILVCHGNRSAGI